MTILEFRQASGLRKSVYHILTDEQICSLKADIAAIKADVSVFRFNEGLCTCYFDDVDMRRIVYGSDYQQNQTKTD
jgi:hypothetical protein